MVMNLQPVEIMAKQHFPAKRLNILREELVELVAYKDAVPPFNPGMMPSARIPVKFWWFSVRNNTTATVIVVPTVLLYSIVPQPPQSSFSLMKWVNAPPRASQNVGTIKRLTKVRTPCVWDSGWSAREAQVSLQNCA